MIREEERNKASKDYRNFRESCGVKDPIMLDEIEEAYYEGTEWADNNPRTDTIGVDSISHIRRILIRNFHNIAKRYHNVTISDVSEINEAFDMIINFDKACKFVGWSFDNKNGIYVINKNYG